MRKLSLDINELQVESFDTAVKGKRDRGTVRAHAETDRNDTYCGGCSDSTCIQAMCNCTAPGGFDSCNPSYCGSCDYNGCETIPLCPTNPGYQGC